MDIKLFDSELKVMCVLWNEGDTTAKHISDVLKKEIGWNMNTTYTLIKRCIKKGAIERSEPKFIYTTSFQIFHNLLELLNLFSGKLFSA